MRGLRKLVREGREGERSRPAGLRYWPAKGASQAPERLPALRSLALTRGKPAKLGGAFLARTTRRARKYWERYF